MLPVLSTPKCWLLQKQHCYIAAAALPLSLVCITAVMLQLTFCLPCRMVYTVGVAREGLHGPWAVEGVQFYCIVPATAQKQVSPLHVPAETAALQDTSTTSP